jgi:hypothetical protein
MNDLNAIVAWIGILAGVLMGIGLGLRFHDPDWLGGYGAWPRRLLRLGHISFFGIALLNLAFAVTVQRLGWQPATRWAGIGLAAAQGLMPAVCFLAAWRPGFRRAFFVPVSCVLVGVVGLLLGRAIS